MILKLLHDRLLTILKLPTTRNITLQYTHNTPIYILYHPFKSQLETFCYSLKQKVVT